MTIMDQKPADALQCREAARNLGITERTLYTWRNKGLIESCRPNNGKVMIPRSEIERLTKGAARGND